MIRTHNVGVEGLHINVSDGAAGKRPHFGFVFESSSDLQEEGRKSELVATEHTENLALS